MIEFDELLRNEIWLELEGDESKQKLFYKDICQTFLPSELDQNKSKVKPT